MRAPSRRAPTPSTSRTVRRVTPDRQWDQERVLEITGLPWNMQAGRLIGRPRRGQGQQRGPRLVVLPPLAAAEQAKESEDAAPEQEAEQAEEEPEAQAVKTPAKMEEERAAASKRTLEPRVLAQQFFMGTPGPQEPVTKRQDAQSTPEPAAHGAKREAETTLEDLSGEPGEAAVVGMLSTVDEDDKDPDETGEPQANQTEGQQAADDLVDSDPVDEQEAEQARARGRQAELTKMAEFGLCVAAPRARALQNGWRILGFRWVD